jgi:hypothetical protein
MDQAMLDASVGGQAVEPVPAELDPAPPGRNETGHGVEDRRLAGPVRTEQGDDLPLVHAEGDVPEHLEVPVGDAEALDAEHGPSQA